MELISSGTSAQMRNKREFKHNHEQGRAKLIIRTRNHRRFKEEMHFGINTPGVFLGGSYSFRCFQNDGEFIPDTRSSDKEIPFAKVKFGLGNCKLL